MTNLRQRSGMNPVKFRPSSGERKSQRPPPEPLPQQGNVDCTTIVTVLFTLIVIVSMICLRN
ncbi:hypothetical protein Hdeb2414_s0027g00688241 [Helianthus debilis subsp. tardiflorus]